MSGTSLNQVAGRRPAKKYEGGRVCSADGCKTVLSQYNKNKYCWQHFQPIPRPARIPGPAPKS